MKRTRFSIIILALLLASCGTPATLQQPTKPADNAVTDTSPPYAKLAAIDAMSPNPPASAIAEFKGLFESLTTKCWKDSPSQIADYIVKGQELFKEKGHDLSLLEITRAVNKSIPDGTQVAKCYEIVGSLIVLTK